MTTKQFWIFTCTMALAVFGGLTLRPIPVRAQTVTPGMGLAFLTPVASVSACAWPAGWPTGATMPAIALCGLTTGQIATATNGGAFSVQTGVAGPQGIPGTNGTNGAPGAAATITVGTVTTLPAGSNATVTNSGTANAAVLNFGIPAGATGPAGPSGGVSSVNGKTGAVTLAASTTSTTTLQ